jgi:hypothetical protein
MFLKWPLWLDAGDWPWTCTRDGVSRPMADGDACQSCGGWEPRIVNNDQQPGGAR